MSSRETSSPDFNAESQQLSTDTPKLGTQAPLPHWDSAPEMVLANIFSFLPVLDRHNAAQVCTVWQAASSHPSVWRHFHYGVTHPDQAYGQPKKLFDELRSDHELYLHLIETYGDKFSRVHIVLYHQESFDILQKLTEVCRGLKCCILQAVGSLRFSEDNRRVVSMFLSANTDAREICLRNVDFSTGNEHNCPFPIGPAHTRSLRKLSLVNSFRQNNLSALMYLINLTELTIIPHQIRFTWLNHLARSSLHTLNIVNMVGVWKFDFHILPEENWKQIAQCPQLRVHCYFVDLYNCSKLLCPGIPLATLVCCEYFNLKLKPFHQVLTKYSETLTTFVYYSQNEKSYQCRALEADAHVLAIIQNCPKLKTMAVKDSLHSSTLLLMVQLSPSFREPIIREDMIHYQLHIPQDLTLSQDMRAYTEANFCRENFAAAMSHLLQREWRPLSQKEYVCVLKTRYTSW